MEDKRTDLPQNPDYSDIPIITMILYNIDHYITSLCPQKAAHPTVEGAPGDVTTHGCAPLRAAQ